MDKKKIAHLDSDKLYSMGDAMKVQNFQLDALEEEKDTIEKGLDYLGNLNTENRELLEQLESMVDGLLQKADSEEDFSGIEDVLQEKKELNITKEKAESFSIKKTKTFQTHNNWEQYTAEYKTFAEEYSINLENDPFVEALSQREYEELQKEINDEFAKKTSIANKTDLNFLAVATALQVTKALLFPLVADMLGYGESFDADSRLAHNDRSIVQEEKNEKNAFRDKKISEGNEKAEWMEILYRTPPYDITKGSPSIGFNMEGKYHRIHTLGHDPILGWVFGTANILTDTVTFDTFQTYKVIRKPKMRIIPEKVPFLILFQETLQKINEGKLNLPAALLAEKLHLKSDEFTKCGLPVPVLEVISPDIAGRLYKEQYDALCFSRDLKVVGASAAISVLIDMIIGLFHGMYYDKEKDGTRNMYEIRTRKILLISNTIATTSNIIASAVTQNPKGLDIGGLLVTVSHLFLDTRFMLNVKKEFIENKIYEKIEQEIEAIKENQNEIFNYEYQLNA